MVEKNAIFQDWHKNLMVLSNDKSHLSQGTMTPKKFQPQLIQKILWLLSWNIMWKPCFGIWISESAPYLLPKKYKGYAVARKKR